MEGLNKMRNSQPVTRTNELLIQGWGWFVIVCMAITIIFGFSLAYEKCLVSVK
jgi:hypothetical protein